MKKQTSSILQKVIASITVASLIMSANMTVIATDGEESLIPDETQAAEDNYARDDEGNIIYDEEGNPVIIEESGDKEPVLDEEGNPVLDEDGNPVYSDGNGGKKPVLDEDGNPVLDEDGNPVYSDEDDEDDEDEEDEPAAPVSAEASVASAVTYSSSVGTYAEAADGIRRYTIDGNTILLKPHTSTTAFPNMSPGTIGKTHEFYDESKGGTTQPVNGYYLAQDVTITSTGSDHVLSVASGRVTDGSLTKVTYKGEYYLDLNGHSIKYNIGYKTNPQFSVISVGAGTTLHIIDSAGDNEKSGIIFSDTIQTGIDPQLFYCLDNSKLILEGGTIGDAVCKTTVNNRVDTVITQCEVTVGGTAKVIGGTTAFYLTGSTLNVEGGQIEGGICSGKFNMTDGEINGYLEGVTVDISGGKIDNNVDDGAAIRPIAAATVNTINISGGTVSARGGVAISFGSSNSKIYFSGSSSSISGNIEAYCWDTADSSNIVLNNRTNTDPYTGGNIKLLIKDQPANPEDLVGKYVVKANSQRDADKVTTTVKDYGKVEYDNGGLKIIFSPTVSTVTLHLNGGSITGGSGTAGSDGTYSIEYNEGYELPLPEPNKAGSYFDGWYDRESGGSRVEKIEESDTGDIELWAVWNANGYKIRFNDISGATLTFSDGSKVSGKTTHTYDCAVGNDYTLPDVEKDGFYFKGWYFASDEECSKDHFDHDFIAEKDEIFDLYAKFANGYKLTLNDNGKTTVIAFEENVGIPESEFPKLNDDGTKYVPTRDGYRFDGWFEGDTEYKSVPDDLNRNITLTAKWTKIYSLTYDLNGGESISTGTTENVYYGEQDIDLPAGIWAGHRFMGWYDGDKFVGKAGDKFTVNGDITTLKARWEVTPSITYVLDGGTCAGAPSVYTQGEALQLPTPAKPGFNFGGWYDNSSFSGSTVRRITASDTGNKTFYAKWNRNTAMLTLDCQGGTIDNPSNYAGYTEGIGLILPIPRRIIGDNEYSFTGWYDINGKGPITRITTLDKGDISLYARWGANSNDVTLILDAGIGTVYNADSYNGFYHGDAVTLPVPEWEDHHFVGWYDNDINNPFFEIPANKYSAGNEVTLQAKWADNFYSLYLNLDGGMIDNEYNYLGYNVGERITFPIPIKDGYEFEGWYNDVNGQKVEGLKGTEDGVQSFTAKWSRRCSLTLVLDGGTIPSSVYGDELTRYENYTFYREGIGLVLPVPQKSDTKTYFFDGWYRERDFSGSPVTLITDKDVGDQVFYAKWLANSEGCSLTLNLNGGYLPNAYNYSGYNSDRGLTLPVPEWEKHNFLGWYEVISGTEASDPTTRIRAGEKGNKTFNAKWEETDATLTLYPEGGTIANENNYKGYKVGKGLILPVPQRPGYIFRGWRDSTYNIKSSITTSDSGNISLWALWDEPTYKLTLHANGGTIPNEYNYTGYIEGEALALPIPQKDNNIFICWTDRSGNTVTQISETDQGDKEYWAKWEECDPNRRLYLHSDGGTIYNATNYEFYKNGINTLPIPEKIGYNFAGWHSDSSLTGDPIWQFSGAESGDKHFYAEWYKNSPGCTLTLNANGGVIPNEYNYTSFTQGKPIYLPTPERDGYTFRGWYEKSSLRGDPVEMILSSDYTQYKTIIVLYAKWILVKGEKSYDVKYYDADGSEIRVDEEYTFYTQGIGLTLPVVYKEGYNFGGWYSDRDLTGRPVTRIFATATGQKEFYAKWNEIDVRLNLVLNDNGEAYIYSEDNYKGFKKSEGITLPVPQREGYNFGGWYRDNNSFTEGPVSKIPPSNEEPEEGESVTLYAQWHKNDHKLTLYTNGGTIPNAYNYLGFNEDVGIVLPQDIFRDGYTFGGWFDNRNLTGNPVTKVEPRTSTDQKFWAKWTAIGETDYGTVFVDIETKGNYASQIKISDSDRETLKNKLKDALITDADIEEYINQGEDIRIVMTITADSNFENQDEIDEVYGGTMALNLDISVKIVKYLGGKGEEIPEESVKETLNVVDIIKKNPLTLTIEVPTDLRDNSERWFYIIREHEETKDILWDEDFVDNTVTFTTDRFSTYTLAYVDNDFENPHNPNSPNNPNNPNKPNNPNDPNNPDDPNNPSNPGNNNNNSNDDGFVVPNRGDGSDSENNNPGDSNNPGSSGDSNNPNKPNNPDVSDSNDPNNPNGGSQGGNKGDGQMNTGSSSSIQFITATGVLAAYLFFLLYYTTGQYGMTEDRKNKLVKKLIAWGKKHSKLSNIPALSAILLLLVYYYTIGQKVVLDNGANA